MSKVARYAEHLVAIADLGSFMKAARTLEMTQPTLSRIRAGMTWVADAIHQYVSG